MEMVINCIYYNPSVTLQILEQHGWTNKFFSLWFSNIENFNRVHDKKLSIVAIVALIQLPAEHVPQSIQPGWPKLMQGIVQLFQTLPVAMKNREEIQKEGLTIDDTYDTESDTEWEGEATWSADADEGDEADIPDESSAYMDFLNSEAQARGGSSGLATAWADEEEDLEEETLLETPLDHVEPYMLFRSALMDLQNTQPHIYEGLTKALSEDDRNVIKGVIMEAEAKSRASEATAAALGVKNGSN